MKKLNFYLYLIIFFISLSGISAASSFKEGKELFESNNVEEAVIYFEEALITKPTGDVYKYLAESYNILGMPDDEILVLEEAISEDVGDMSYFNFKLGNAYQLAGDYNGALKCFLNVITINKDYVNETFLNIANVSVELKQYSSAIDNYSKYLELVPESTQKRKIVKMIFVLKKLQKEELEKQAEANKLEEAERLAKEEEALRLEEERLNETAMNQQLQEEREAKARALEEERLLYDNESQQYQEELANFRDAEGKVVNPPDPDIEAWRKLLEQKEQELAEREKRIQEAEEALRLSEEAASESEADKVETTLTLTPEEIQAAKELEEFNRKKKEEEERQQALMNEILQSLEKIGENAQGINASTEGVYDELEGSDIDE